MARLDHDKIAQRYLNNSNVLLRIQMGQSHLPLFRYEAYAQHSSFKVVLYAKEDEELFLFCLSGGGEWRVVGFLINRYGRNSPITVGMRARDPFLARLLELGNLAENARGENPLVFFNPCTNLDSDQGASSIFARHREVL